MEKKTSYKAAGVDIAAGEKAVERIKDDARSTFTPRVLTELGKFGGFFALDRLNYKQPVLVSSIDGVGTKLKVAFLMKKHDTIGEDLVNHCVNDILVGGAKPLFFLDYIGVGKLDPGIMEAIVSGMARACRQTGCALIGGEMAEMPGIYQSGEYDVAGCITGIVEKERIVDGSRITQGDILIGLPSSGLHTNGYSLARKILFESASLTVDAMPEELNMSLGEALLQVHICYLKSVHPLLDQFDVHGMSHVTGGGLVGNTNRILPDGFRLNIEWNAWKIPSIFRLIQKLGNIEDQEMRRTFNLGIGFVLIADKKEADRIIQALEKSGEAPVVVGEVVSG